MEQQGVKLNSRLSNFVDAVARTYLFPVAFAQRSPRIDFHCERPRLFGDSRGHPSWNTSGKSLAEAGMSNLQSECH